MGVKKRALKQKSNSVQTLDANKTNNSNKKETRNSLVLAILYSIANTLKLVLIILAILFIIWLHLQLRSAKRQLETKTKEITTLKNKLEFISKENNNYNDSLAINETEVEEFPELTRYIGKIKHGHNPEVTVLFASENTGDTKEQIISLARYVLFDKDLVNCLNRNESAEFDVYKSCFRDISIELFNSIQEKFRTDWVVTVGVVDNCFMVTDIAYNHEEYFFQFDGKIYFEVFRLPDNVGNQTKPQENTESVKSEQIDDNNDQIENQQTRQTQNLTQQIDDQNEENEQLVADTKEIDEELVSITEENEEELVADTEENEETIKA